MTTRIVHDPLRWGPQFPTHPHRPVLIRWLADNGIHWEDVPFEQRIRLEDQTIHYVAYTRRGGGERLHGVAVVYGHAVVEARTAACVVPPPRELVAGEPRPIQDVLLPDFDPA